MYKTVEKVIMQMHKHDEVKTDVMNILTQTCGYVGYF